VSLEAARLLKEKGYNEEVELFYNTLGELKNVSDLFYCEVADNTQMAKYDYCSAPAKAQAIDWLESKGIVVGVAYHRSFDRYYFGLDYKNGELLPYQTQYELFLTRLEAEEAAIIKALELL
jgi:hypothetical protein